MRDPAPFAPIAASVVPILILALLSPLLLASVPATAQDEEERIDLNFSRIDLVVWGNGTRFSEFQVDAAPGDRVDVTAVVQLSRNGLRSARNATLDVSFDAEALQGIGANATFVVGPDMGRFVEVGPVNVTLPRDLAFGTYTMVMELDVGDVEAFPQSNVRRVPIGVGPRSGELGADVSPGHFVAAFALVAVGIGTAVFARRYHAPAMAARRRASQDSLDRMRAWWSHHPRRRALRAGATAGVLVLLLVVFAGRGFFVLPRWDVLAGRLVTGILVGAIYALVALGYTMVYGVLKFINFGHGEVFMWGAYAAFFIAADLGYSFWGAVLGAVVFAAVLGATIERVAYRPLRGKPRLTPLITAIGVSLFLAGASQFFFSTQSRSFRGVLEATPFLRGDLYGWLDSETLSLLGVPVDTLGLVVLVASVLFMAGLHLFVQYSRLGKAMRAVADDMETASVIGIDVNRVVTTTFVIGSALAAVGGILYGMRFSLRPTMGFLPGIKAFTAAVVGGIGNVYGAFAGGFLIGLAEMVGGAFLKEKGFQEAIAFVILIVVLIVRPTGLFRAKESEVRRK